MGYKDDVLDSRKHYWNYRDDDDGRTDIRPSSSSTSGPQIAPDFGILRISGKCDQPTREYRVPEFGRLEHRFSHTPENPDSWSDWKDVPDTQLNWLDRSLPEVDTWLRKRRGNGEQLMMWSSAFIQRTFGKWDEIRAREAEEKGKG